MSPTADDISFFGAESYRTRFPDYVEQLTIKCVARGCYSSCTYGYMCAKHAAEKGCCISTSSLPNAGRGLFACKKYRYGEVIDVFFGIEYKNQDFENWNKSERHLILESGNMPSWMYALRTSGVYIPKLTTSSFAMYANDPRSYSRTNAIYRTDRKQQFPQLVASKIIHPGQEIFVRYDSQFWKMYEQLHTAQLMQELDNDILDLTI